MDFTREQMTCVVSALESVIRDSDDPAQTELLQWAVEVWRGALAERSESNGPVMTDRVGSNFGK